MKHIELLINFVAAYGTHESVTSVTTLAGKRAAATALVQGGALGSATFNLDAYNFMNSLGTYANSKGDQRAIHDASGAAPQWSTGSVTGVDAIDFWIGGLAEKISLFGGVLGSTFEFVFRTQMEALQDADRLYYLPRVEGMDYEDSLQDNSLAQMIRANTGIKHLPGNIFLTPEYTVEAADYFNKDGSVKKEFIKSDGSYDTTKWLHNPVTGKLLVDITSDGTLQFVGDDNFLGNTIVLGGTEGNESSLPVQPTTTRSGVMAATTSSTAATATTSCSAAPVMTRSPAGRETISCMAMRATTPSAVAMASIRSSVVTVTTSSMAGAVTTSSAVVWATTSFSALKGLTRYSATAVTTGSRVVVARVS